MPRKVSVEGKKPRGLEGEHKDRIRAMGMEAKAKLPPRERKAPRNVDRHFIPPTTDKISYTNVQRVEHTKLIMRFIINDQMPLHRLTWAMRQLVDEKKISPITNSRIKKLYDDISAEVVKQFERTRPGRQAMMVSKLEELIYKAQNGVKDGSGNYVVKPDLKVALLAMDQLSELTGLYPEAKSPLVNVNIGTQAGPLTSAPSGVQQYVMDQFTNDKNASNIIDGDFTEEKPAVALVNVR